MTRRKVGHQARSRQIARVERSSNTERIGTNAHPTSEQAAAGSAVETEALSVTHWFDAEQDGEPYAATIRFIGRRIGVPGKPGSRDAFVKEETVGGIVPGSGAVSITTWVYGLEPGAWTVTADLLRHPKSTRARHPSAGENRGGAHTLPRAAWSWRRWALSTGQFTPVQTRWAPLVRLARTPAVIPGSWSGLIAVGVLVGAFVQAALLARANISVGLSFIVDLVALVSGLVLAKLWYLALRPRGSWRQSIGEGWTVDGLLFAAPAVGIAALLAYNLPIGLFLDASAPGLFFGVAIGRLGCFFTGCCAGRCTRSRWGMWSSDRCVGARRIPTQLLESATGLLIGIVTTLLVLRSPSPAGAIFVAAVAAYVLVRQFLLRLRAEPHNPVRSRLTAAAAGLVLLADALVLLLSAS
ncbi:MAG: prolipoprotein diacylglyceryl transferase [Chloroflexi bacterium]|nr:prolipoprotein diacylglyceryl transferase [Chloroflexota bacterium]